MPKINDGIAGIASIMAAAKALDSTSFAYAETRHPAFLFAGLWAIAAIFLFVLSGMLGVREGAPITQRLDVLFSSDVSNRIHNLSGADAATEELREHRFSVSHPLLNQVWGTLGAVTTAVAASFTSEGANIVGACLLVAMIGALGIAALCIVAWRTIPSPWPRVLLLLATFLCTANVLVAVPDHYGISVGLLGLAFYAAVSPGMPYRIPALAVITGLTAATTITNALFPAVCFAVAVGERIPAAQLKKYLRVGAVGSAIFVVAAIIGLVASGKLENAGRGDTIVHKFWKVRIAENPKTALLLVPAAVVYPVVGPDPRVVQGGLSYEPVDFRGFGPLQAIGAAALLLLFCLCLYRALASTATRSAALLAAGWIGFNVAFHSIWGDEFFLYSPHWSWAVMAVLILGIRFLQPRTAACLAALVIPGQVVALASITQTLAQLS